MILYNSPETNATNENMVLHRERERAVSEQDAEILIGKIRSYIPFYCWMLYE